MARVVHFDVHADNPERAAAFYERVFGWRFQHIPAIDYWMIMTGESPASMAASCGGEDRGRSMDSL